MDLNCGGTGYSEPGCVFLHSDPYLSGTTIFALCVPDGKLQTKTLMMYSLVSLVLNTLLNIVLFKMMGMIGPAVATLLCAFVYMMLVLKEINRLRSQN